jgi:hypothetical protein
MLNRMKHLAKMYLPFGLMSSLREMKLLTKDNHSFSGEHSYDNVWASVATSFNYISPAHVDKDAFFSCLTVSYVPKGHSGKYNYAKDLPIAVYFVFPEYNQAIGMRPGDVLFFNPLHYHCLSQRTKEYSNEEIFVTSFYMKSSQLSGNNNSIPL